jgi:DNA-binding transcriptional ArsR family regulator
MYADVRWASNVGAAVRVVDLRSSTSSRAGPEVVVVASPAAELLRLIGVLVSPDEILAEYDLGAERIRELRSRVPDDLLADIQGIGTSEHDQGYLVLSLVAAELPEPAGIAELSAALEADPGLAWRTLLAHGAQELADAPDDLAERIVSGDDDAVQQLRDLAAKPACPDTVTELLGSDPIAFGQQIASIVRRFDAAVNRDVEEEAMGPVRRDVAYRRQQLEDGMDPAEVVVAATNGYALSEDRAVRRIVLLPSYWMRPWLVVGRHGGAVEIFTTVVGDEFLALPSEAPPPSLLKLCKALSDESRLKLLRRMSSGPVSLSEATDELDVAKATAHHHLSILRQAGLVTMAGTGRSTRYALRGDPSTITQEAIAAYVPSRH